MKKLITVLLTALILITSVNVGVCASSTRLSYGLDVIAYNLELSKTGLVGDKVTFAARDFEDTLGVSKISGITVLTLPDAESGALELSGIPVMKNQIISAKNIENLTFVPKDKSEIEVSFVVGSVSSSQPLAITCKISLTDSLNFAPEVMASPDGTVKMKAMQGVACYLDLDATDPENDGVFYKVTSYPKNGTLKMVDREEGYLCYKAIGAFTGNDSFTVVACDKYGNTSEQISVNVTVETKASQITYCDMDGDPALYAAMKLGEKGIMVGDTVCSMTYFRPDERVSREEFLAMAMCCAGITPESTKESVSFADADQISEYLADYLVYADKKGYVSAYVEDNGGVFGPKDDVTGAQACLILYNLSGCDYKGESQAFADADSIPAWAREPLDAMVGEGILSLSDYKGADMSISRSDAAILLYNFMEYMNEK